ncbi:hypothetical protein HPP92_029161 [Vanilla planifolia]|uniref:Uncharacterized protein n=1 Tax=Vanilla planifolia TaxID=51239 RepID=A0A835P6G8_VANPL|nr:hypothetical protein HPP92_029161 [Vanilla planifolia]KAG0445808.1 hypothetical protein HPP92_029150 [Vanilla planifolia]
MQHSNFCRSGLGADAFHSILWFTVSREEDGPRPGVAGTVLSMQSAWSQDYTQLKCTQAYMWPQSFKRNRNLGKPYAASSSTAAHWHYRVRSSTNWDRRRCFARAYGLFNFIRLPLAPATADGISAFNAKDFGVHPSPVSLAASPATDAAKSTGLI